MTPTEMKTKCPNSMDGLDPRKKKEREEEKEEEEGNFSPLNLNRSFDRSSRRSRLKNLGQKSNFLYRSLTILPLSSRA